MREQQFLEDIAAIHHFARKFFKGCSYTHEELNKTQINVLMAVGKNKDNTMTQISQEVGLEKGSFTSVVDSLIEKGYLERIRSEKDRRKISLQLTEEGKMLAYKAHAQMGHHMCDMFKGTDEETLEEIRKAVHTLADFARTFKD